jgi:hypothetical protein
MAKFLQALTATIPLAGTTSGFVTMPTTQYALGIITPAALTGASFTFEGSIDAVTFRPLYNEGTLYSVTVAASRYIALNPSVMQSVKHLKIVSGSSEGALRVIQIVIGE